jgi:hypothetical protein
MKALWVTVVVLVAGVALLVGCGNQSPSSEKEFDKLYKQYSARFYERMRMDTVDPETLNPTQVMLEAAKTWDEVFAPHKDLLKTRSEELLKNLDDAAPLQEDLYVEVFPPFKREDPIPDLTKANVPKQLFWSPTLCAANSLNEWLSGILQPPARAARQFMLGNAGLSWEAVDRNIDHPRLQVHQGPHVFQVDLTRVDDFYLATKVRWLKPKSMSTPSAPAATGSTTPSAGTLPATTPEAMPPVTTPPAKTPSAKTPAGKTSSATPKG